jgi:hypothetical protein
VVAWRSREKRRPAGRRVPSALVCGAVLLLVGAMWLLAGCSVKTGVTQEMVVDEPLGSAAVTDVEIDMGAGTLTLAPGAVGLASGTIRYNVESWKPTISRSDKSLTIKQGSQKGLSGLGGRVVNDWDLELGKAPMRLKISAGAYDGSYDLSGLTLQDLTIKDGAAKTEVVFNSVNPGQMERFDYATGASTVKLIGLANANFKSMKFEGGAGSYSLDFSGQLRTDASVQVEIGAGSLRIVVPAATAARVTVGGSLNDIDTEGVWTVTTNSTYSTSVVGTAGQGKMLNISVDMNVGSVTLVAE